MFLGTAFGSSCSGTGTGDCTEKKNIVCDTNCKCTTDSFRNNTSECATSKNCLLVVVGSKSVKGFY